MSMFYVILSISIGLLCLALILIMIRFVKGPSLPDRIVALDLFSSQLIAIIAIYSIISGVRNYLDVALVLSLVTFIGTMAFANYITNEEE